MESNTILKEIKDKVERLEEKVDHNSGEVSELNNTIYGGKHPQKSMLSLLDGLSKTVEQLIIETKERRGEERKNRRAIIIACISAMGTFVIGCGTVIYQSGVKSEQFNNSLLQIERNTAKASQNHAIIIQIKQEIARLAGGK